MYGNRKRGVFLEETAGTKKWKHKISQNVR